MTASTKYGERALAKTCARVAATPEGSRENTLYAEACSIGEMIQVGDVEYGEAWDGLVAAGQDSGLAYRAARRCTNHGLDKGIQSNATNRRPYVSHATPLERERAEREYREYVQHIYDYWSAV